MKVFPPFPHLRFLKPTVQMALFSGALYHSEHQPRANSLFDISETVTRCCVVPVLTEETTKQKHLFCCILHSLSQYSSGNRLKTDLNRTATDSHVHSVYYIIMGCNMLLALLYIAIHSQDRSGEVITLFCLPLKKKASQ